MSMTWLPTAPRAPPPLTASLHQVQSAPTPGCNPAAAQRQAVRSDSSCCPATAHSRNTTSSTIPGAWMCMLLASRSCSSSMNTSACRWRCALQANSTAAGAPGSRCSPCPAPSQWRRPAAAPAPAGRPAQSAARGRRWPPAGGDMWVLERNPVLRRVRTEYRMRTRAGQRHLVLLHAPASGSA
jgi:hypothetical protein